MTEKELLYVQDVLGHEKHFRTECRNAAEQLQDGELKTSPASWSKSTAKCSKAFTACCKEDMK